MDLTTKAKSIKEKIDKYSSKFKERYLLKTLIRGKSKLQAMTSKREPWRDGTILSIDCSGNYTDLHLGHIFIEQNTQK